jgi:Na+/melibiose symporter-like transporter
VFCGYNTPAPTRKLFDRHGLPAIQTPRRRPPSHKHAACIPYTAGHDGKNASGSLLVTIKRRTLAGFVLPCVPIASVGLPVVVYLPPYYAGTLGLDLAVVGFLFFAIRLVDVPFDPLIGHLIDRTRTRFGRFRPWLAGGGALMAAGVFVAFIVAKPGISAPAAFAGLLLMYLGFSATVVPHTSWGATLSDDYNDRSRIFGWWQAMNLLGLLSILAVPPLAQSIAGSKDPSIGIHAMGWVVVIGVPLTLLFNLASDILQVARLPLLRRLLVVDLFASMAPGLTGAMFVFFFEAARGYTPAQSSTLLLFYFAAGMLSAPLWARLARRFTKHRTLVWALCLYCVTQTATLLIPSQQFWFAAAAMTVAGIPAVAPAFLLRAMLADLSDAETLRSGEERTGLFYSVLTATQKIGYAIPVGVTYAVLDRIGFVPALGSANTAGAIDGLEMLFVAPPVLVALLAAYFARNWPIGAEDQARNARALAA